MITDPYHTAFVDWQKRYEEMSPEMTIRWHLLHGCSCHVVEGWDMADNHYGGCPLENKDDEGWYFFDAFDILPCP